MSNIMSPVLWFRNLHFNLGIQHEFPNVNTARLAININAGADLGNYGWGGGRVCVSKGAAIDRETKCRAGGGYGKGVSPSLCGRKLKLETV